MPEATLPGREYLDTLLQYYEEEVVGEAEFYRLAEYFPEREKTMLLARVERAAADTVKPLLDKYCLVPREDVLLRAEGLSDAKPYQSWNWTRYMDYVVERFPGYLDDFYRLEAMAPAEDLPRLQRLTAHELAVIEFAAKELAGHTDSVAPLLVYLDKGSVSTA